MKTTAGNDTKHQSYEKQEKMNRKSRKRDGLQQFTGHATEDIKDSRLQRKKELERMTGRRRETDEQNERRLQSTGNATHSTSKTVKLQLHSQ